MKNLFKKITLFFIFLFFTNIGFSHELWLEPKKFNLLPNQKLEAHIKVGQNLNGDSFPYISAETSKLNLFLNKTKIQLKHRDGDYPAIQVNLNKRGTYILTYESTPEILKYENFEKFTLFLQEQGLWDKRIFVPTNDIIESYTRFAKSIIQVGDSYGADFKSDLLFELVAKDPIKNFKTRSNILVKLFYDNQPYQNSQISIFRLHQNKLDIYKVVTNNRGEAKIPTKEGGIFLLSSVYLSNIAQSKTESQWKSLWASLTFEIK